MFMNSRLPNLYLTQTPFIIIQLFNDQRNNKSRPQLFFVEIWSDRRKNQQPLIGSRLQ